MNNDETLNIGRFTSLENYLATINGFYDYDPVLRTLHIYFKECSLGKIKRLAQLLNSAGFYEPKVCCDVDKGMIVVRATEIKVVGKSRNTERVVAKTEHATQQDITINVTKLAV